ncbi:MAG: phytoene desaturase [Chlorobi bacterium]|nr:phytoene desaturase [Chlorobiota bacterium]MCI0716500.1 phytoene desaturase [Chlorobiota bacterium]
MGKKVIVIGSGFGGFGAAIRLAARGHEVEIFEKLDKPGGRAYVWELNGFKFDGGPTVITAPFLLEELFELTGRKMEDYFALKPLNPFYRIFNYDGRYFDYNNDIDFTLNQIGKFNPNDKHGYLNFINSTKAIFQKGFVELADKPFLSFLDMLKIAPILIKLKSYKNVYSYVSSFIKDDFLRRCFSFHPLLVGGNPFNTTSIYTLIHHLEREWGVHYAIGGTGSIVNGLAKLFQELGGKIHYNSEVEEITVKNGKAIGIRLKNCLFIEADLIVSNADIGFTYLQMIEKRLRKKNTDRKIENMKYSMSLFVIYFGTKKRYNSNNLVHHNIIFGKRYKELLEDIFKNKVLADDFSLYLHMPTATDSTIAPEGCEAFYVLSPVPHLKSGTNWKTEAKPYRDKIMNFLEENYLPNLQENIIAEHYIDPLHFQNNLNSYLGSAFSFEPLFSQSAWFRPHNKSEDIENLYFVGAGTHPGAGLPGVLSSAKITDKLIN